MRVHSACSQVAHKCQCGMPTGDKKASMKLPLGPAADPPCRTSHLLCCFQSWRVQTPGAPGPHLQDCEFSARTSSLCLFMSWLSKGIVARLLETLRRTTCKHALPPKDVAVLNSTTECYPHHQGQQEKKGQTGHISKDQMTSCGVLVIGTGRLGGWRGAAVFPRCSKVCRAPKSTRATLTVKHLLAYGRWHLPWHQRNCAHMDFTGLRVSCELSH